eukprot:1135898-Prorocentrum_minimum.AAC.1
METQTRTFGILRQTFGAERVGPGAVIVFVWTDNPTGNDDAGRHVSGLRECVGPGQEPYGHGRSAWSARGFHLACLAEKLDIHHRSSRKT